MIRTSNEIEGFFFKTVRASALGKRIKGELYRPGTRPANRREEDIIVEFVGGMDGQVQEGAVHVNVYVKDVPSKTGELVIHHERIGELESLVQDLVADFRGSDYYVRTTTTAKAYAVRELDQHCFTIRLEFKVLTD